MSRCCQTSNLNIISQCALETSSSLLVLTTQALSIRNQLHSSPRLITTADDISNHETDPRFFHDLAQASERFLIEVLQTIQQVRYHEELNAVGTTYLVYRPAQGCVPITVQSTFGETRLKTAE